MKKPQEGALRELAEEAGYVGKLKLLGSYYTNHRRSKSKLYVYTAINRKKKNAKRDPEEEFETNWFTVKEIDGLIANNEILNDSFLSAWSLYKAKK